MSLQNIEYGSVARSQILNENFEYLDDRITDVGSSITTVQSNLASVSANLSNEINNLNYATPEDLENEVGTINDAIDALEGKVNEISFFPAYNNRQSRSVNTDYIATEPGWVYVYAQSTNANATYYYINDVAYNLSSNGNNDTDTAGAGAWFIVDVGDKYKLSSSGWQWGSIYFLPLKGGN